MISSNNNNKIKQQCTEQQDNPQKSSNINNSSNKFNIVNIVFPPYLYKPGSATFFRFVSSSAAAQYYNTLGFSPHPTIDYDGNPSSPGYLISQQTTTHVAITTILFANVSHMFVYVIIQILNTTSTTTNNNMCMYERTSVCI